MDKAEAKLERGFTFLELAIVLGVIGLVVAVSVTNYRAITRDRKFAQAEKDLQVLKGAVFSYWKQNSLRYPKDVNRSLASSRPHGADETLKDPWRKIGRAHV